jgi:hypothetical protein
VIPTGESKSVMFLKREDSVKIVGFDAMFDLITFCSNDARARQKGGDHLLIAANHRCCLEELNGFVVLFRPTQPPVGFEKNDELTVAIF